MQAAAVITQGMAAIMIIPTAMTTTITTRAATIFSEVRVKDMKCAEEAKGTEDTKYAEEARDAKNAEDVNRGVSGRTGGKE